MLVDEGADEAVMDVGSEGPKAFSLASRRTFVPSSL